MTYVLYAILTFILYKFIFKLVIPVYLATRKIKKGFREMSARMNSSDGHNRMQEGQSPDFNESRQNGSATQPSSPASGPKTKVGDYIDFEEVK